MTLGPRGQKVWTLTTNISFFLSTATTYWGYVAVYFMLTYDLYFFDWGQLSYNANQTITLLNTTAQSVNCTTWVYEYCPDLSYMQAQKDAGNTSEMQVIYSFIVLAVLLAVTLALIIIDTYMIFFRRPEPEFIEHISDTMPIELVLNLTKDMKKFFSWIKIVKLICYIICCVLPVAFIPFLSLFLSEPYTIKVENIEDFESPQYCLCAYDWSEEWRNEQYVACASGGVAMLICFLNSALNYMNGAVPTYSTYMAFSDKVKFLQVVDAQGPVAAASQSANKSSTTSTSSPLLSSKP